MRQQLYYSDLVALVQEFTTLQGSRLQSVYNVGNTHIYLLKFQTEAGKVFVGLQGGSFILQLHNPPTERPKLPSSFCQKLRKHLKNKRLQNVELLNQDRIMDFQFGSDSFAHHLVVELYGDGNVVLTDNQYKILSFIYPQRYHGERIRVQTNYLDCLSGGDSKQNDDSSETTLPNLKRLEGQLLRTYGKDIAKETIFQIKHTKSELTNELYQSCLNQVLQRITDRPCVGLLYEEMCNPIQYEYLGERPIKSTFPTFSEALETYLSHLWPSTPKPVKEEVDSPEGDEMSVTQRQEATMIRIYQEKVTKLQTQIDRLESEIVYLTDHPDQVQQTLQNPGEIQGVDRTVQHATGTSLGEISLHSKMSYYDNLSHHHHQRKTLHHRLEKGHSGHEKALTGFKQRNVIQKKSSKPTPSRVGLKTTAWYQAFHWFITTHGYLVICGRNSSQNETVVKRYLESRDIYLHSEIAGCGSAVLKVPAGILPESIHPVDLEEAGAFVICHSRAWKDRVPDRAYWTLSNQVSKTTETGEYVQKGSFIVRGKRNYLSQIKLELGIALHESQLMIAPYRRLSSLPADQKLKIVPGKSKRNQGLERIIRKLQLKSSDKKIVDEIVPFQSHIT